MLTNIALVLVAIHIGMLVGAVGVGGILLPSALTMITGAAIHHSMATSLFTFIFTGIAGTIYFHRRGSVDWELAKPVCAGAVTAGFLGAWMNSRLSTSTLSLVLAAIIIFAGAYTLRPARAGTGAPGEASNAHQWPQLAAIGAAAGFASGLTGVGGPVLSVPLMVMCGFPVLTSIGISQVVQVVGALSGTAANLHFRTIDFGLASYLTVFEVGGVLLGAHIIHRVNVHAVKKFVGLLCLLAGAAFMYRSLAAF